MWRSRLRLLSIKVKWKEINFLFFCKGFVIYVPRGCCGFDWKAFLFEYMISNDNSYWLFSVSLVFDIVTENKIGKFIITILCTQNVDLCYFTIRNLNEFWNGQFWQHTISSESKVLFVWKKTVKALKLKWSGNSMMYLACNWKQRKIQQWGLWCVRL